MASLDHLPAHNIFTPRRLRPRGWTNAMIRDLLGEPAGYVTERNGENGATPVKAWRGHDVHAAEASDAFARRAGRARRVIAAASEQPTREEALEWARTAEITLSIMPREALAAAAVFYSDSRGMFGKPSSRTDPRRAQVNYLRHTCTNYDDLWKPYSDHEAGDEVHDILYQRVLERIIEDYPFLARECRRRIDRLAVHGARL